MTKKFKWLQTQPKTFRLYFLGVEIAIIWYSTEWVSMTKNSEKLERHGEDFEKAKLFSQDIVVREMAYYLTEYFQGLENL